ncbi:hypothetical protein RJ639_009088, partial [Escallonia herrerae]
DLQSIENDLLKVSSSDTATIDEHIKKYINQAHMNHDSYCKRLEIVNKCFSKKTVEQILLPLENEVSRGADKWVAKAISSMKSASPTSLKIFLRSVKGKRKSADGSRALLFDKDKNPKQLQSLFGMPFFHNFFPAVAAFMLRASTEEMVEQVFSKVEDDDWEEFEPKDTRNLMNMQKPRL